MFARWAMRYDPARSWLWSPDAIAGGALDRAGKGTFLRVFETVAAAPETDG